MKIHYRPSEAARVGNQGMQTPVQVQWMVRCASALETPMSDPSDGCSRDGRAVRVDNGWVTKVYRQHNCTRAHRKFSAMAKCIWPRAEWISGEGPYATVTSCPHAVYREVITVKLHADQAAAEAALQLINETGCGGSCVKNHELVELQRPE